MPAGNTKTSRNSRSFGAKRRFLAVFLILLAVLFLAWMAAALLSLRWNSMLTVSNYEVRSEKMSSGFRIVLISDLHRRVFGDNNDMIVDLVSEQKPDVICVDGDMLEHENTDEQVEAFRSLLERLAGIAPVYFAAGNHDYDVYGEGTQLEDKEWVAMGKPTETRALLESTGAVFLECAYTDAVINGEQVRIGGLYPYAAKWKRETDATYEPRERFLSEYCDTDDFKLMLSHRPDGFLYGDAAEKWSTDLVLSGHTHGGVVRLPFGLGAVITSEGLFPQHDMGEFPLGGGTMIITSGMNGYWWFPRIFNPPEIAVVDVLPE